MTCFEVDLLKRKAERGPENVPTSPRSDTSTIDWRLSNTSDVHTVIAPHLISEYERRFYYHGVSYDPPELMYRSDFETNTYPIPPPGANFFQIPVKTANGVFNTRLNSVWDDTVAPQILALMKTNGIKYSALKTARFTTVKDNDEVTVGPIVVWIAVHPNTTNAQAVRDATPDILRILTDAQITGVVVEWYEGSVVKLVGPPLVSVVDSAHPTFGFNHPFNTGLGIPIARQVDGAQGTVAFFFKEMKTSTGNPSDRILAVTNKHVLCVDTTIDYEFDENDPQHILVCGDHRITRAVTEMENAIVEGLRDNVSLASNISDLEEKVDMSEEDKEALEDGEYDLEKKRKAISKLATLLNEVSSGWMDTKSRRFGVVDWAPKIDTRVDDSHYTRDVATFVVDQEKLGPNFKANIVDFGAFFLPLVFISLVKVQIFRQQI